MIASRADLVKLKLISYSLITAFYLLVGFFVIVDDSFFILNRLFLFLVLLRFMLVDSTSAQGFIKALIFCLLFAFPVLYFDFVTAYSYYKYLAISIFFLDFLLLLDSRFFLRGEKFVVEINFPRLNFPKLYLILNFFLTSSLLLGALQGLGDFGRVIQFGLFAVSLVFLESIARKGSLWQVYLSFFSYFIYALTFSVFVWSGFGRILLGTYILIPLILLIITGRIKLNLTLMFLVAPLFLIAAQISRHGNLSGFGDLVQGSSSSHIVFASRFYRDSTSDYYGGFAPWLEQMSLLYLNWFPSSLWDDKPLGLGALAVDQWQGRVGVSDRYTLSPGLIGEQIYFLGDLYPLGLLATLFSLFFLRFIVSRVFGNYVVFRSIFYAMLFSLMWGGSATFGSRYWYYVIPLALFIFVFKFFYDGRIKR